MENNLKKAIKSAALRLLAQRDYSNFLLTQKLLKKGFDKTLINETLTELLEQHWLDDKRFAENFINSREKKGYGPLRIQLELREKGISTNIIDEILSTENVNWEELAVKVRQKKFGNDKIANFAEKAKQMNFLQYRGFSAAQIKFALKEDMDDAI